MSDSNTSNQQEVKCFGYPATLQLTIPEGMQASLNLSRKTPLLLRVLQKDKVFRFVLTLGTDNFKDMDGDGSWERRTVEQIVVQEKGSITIPKHIMHTTKLNGYTFFNASLSEGPLGEKRITLDPGVLDDLPEQTRMHLEKNRMPGGQYCTHFHKIRTVHTPVSTDDESESYPAPEASWQVEIPFSMLRRTRLTAGNITIPQSAVAELGWSKGDEISFYVLDGPTSSRRYIILALVKRRLDTIFPFNSEAYKRIGSNPLREAGLFSNTVQKTTLHCTGAYPYKEIALESDTKGKKVLVIYS